MLDAIEDLESSDPEAMEQLVANAAFGSGHPYARSPLGTVDSVTPMGIEEVVERQLDVFVPKGATLLVVGDVRPDAVAAATKAAFGRWDGEPASPLAAVPPPTVPGVSTSRAGERARPAAPAVGGALSVHAVRGEPNQRQNGLVRFAVQR
ncbi:MAG: insulinase family protein [Deltaproteobacteria bacterium]|nr:MAG: insulinase family protein [Deltaproteobacteria bacterium]